MTHFTIRLPRCIDTYRCDDDHHNPRTLAQPIIEARTSSASPRTRNYLGHVPVFEHLLSCPGHACDHRGRDGRSKVVDYRKASPYFEPYTVNYYSGLQARALSAYLGTCLGHAPVFSARRATLDMPVIAGAEIEGRSAGDRPSKWHSPYSVLWKAIMVSVIPCLYCLVGLIIVASRYERLVLALKHGMTCKVKR
ncbi:hypothetical protein DEU56DRAFT_464939 [Suillus clintonianus]|uniref:uncharacterized protein n=1 Tax=Suillus clintonianus TaxID=1904413 RepID=UPI001B87BBE7|nr:uncharacterized protein DEU56DRAFT_464939 [Suillus clintonianus]KAG2130697.1 hypothetical protein DEU56DRAFT_464939 [Suillus clintonianus]